MRKEVPTVIAIVVLMGVIIKATIPMDALSIIIAIVYFSGILIFWGLVAWWQMAADFREECRRQARKRLQNVTGIERLDAINRELYFAYLANGDI